MTDDTSSTDRKTSFAAKLLRPKVAIPLLIVFLALISPLLIRGWYLSGVPNASEPFDAAPLLEYTLSDDENAFTDYRRARSLYVQPSQDVIYSRSNALNRGWPSTNVYASDYLRSFLHDNEVALRAWKQGTGKDEALCMPAKDYRIGAPLDVVEQMSEIHLTVMMLCKKLEAEGKPQEAWEWYRAAVRASRHAGMRGRLIERLAGIDMFQDAAGQLETWAAHPDLTASDLRMAVGQLQADWQMTERASTLMQIEYLTCNRILENFREELGTDMKAESSYVPSGLVLSLVEPDLSLRISRMYFYNQLAFCDLPFYERPGTVGLLETFDDPRGFDPGNGDTWNPANFDAAYQRAILAPLLIPLSEVYPALDREEARYRILVVTLAVQAYYRDHGRFPDTLGELVPDYLDSIPLDNYDGQPLKYRFDPARPIVYSVYESGSGEGGMPENVSPLKLYPDVHGSQLTVPVPEPLAAPTPPRD